MSYTTLSKAKIVGGAFALLALAYPIIAYLGLSIGSPSWVAIGLMLILLLRSKSNSSVMTKSHARLTFVLVLCVLGLSAITNSDLGIRFYPVVINGLLLFVFSTSLYAPMTIIERLARLKEPELPESGIIYTRKVTKVWIGFFILNGGIALYTALYTSIETWTLYNGFIAYILIGILAMTEWLVRRKVRKAYEH